MSYVYLYINEQRNNTRTIYLNRHPT